LCCKSFNVVDEHINKYLRIRRAQPSDKHKILSFCQDTFAWGDYIHIVWDSWVTDRSGLLLVVDMPNPSTLVYDPVAVSHISTCPNGVLWIEGLRVNKTFRNQGIATYLLRYVLKYGFKRGLDESCALVSSKNVISKRMLEKQGFSVNAICRYYNIKMGKTLQFNAHSLKFKYARIRDIGCIQNYLDASEVYSKMDGRYFNEWKFYKLKNTFDGIYDLVSKEKLVLAVDKNDKINGMSIINIVEHKDMFYNKPSLQICYIDCLDYSIYHNFIYLIFETLGAHNQFKDIHFFVENSINLSCMFNDICIDNCEEFIIYSKRLS
jgi:ribosomal protein S18 acetylase RimI-like enzyme